MRVGYSYFYSIWYLNSAEGVGGGRPGRRPLQIFSGRLHAANLLFPGVGILAHMVSPRLAPIIFCLRTRDLANLALLQPGTHNLLFINIGKKTKNDDEATAIITSYGIFQ